MQPSAAPLTDCRSNASTRERVSDHGTCPHLGFASRETEAAGAGPRSLALAVPALQTARSMTAARRLERLEPASKQVNGATPGSPTAVQPAVLGAVQSRGPRCQTPITFPAGSRKVATNRSPSG